MSRPILIAAVISGAMLFAALPARAITVTAPGGLASDVQELNGVEQVHCRPYPHRSRFHRYGRGCRGVVIAPRRRVIIQERRFRAAPAVRSRTTIRTRVRGDGPAVIRSRSRDINVNTRVRSGTETNTNTRVRTGSEPAGNVRSQGGSGGATTAPAKTESGGGTSQRPGGTGTGGNAPTQNQAPAPQQQQQRQ